MILYINTSRENYISVFLIEEKKVKDKIVLKGDYKVSENLMNLINKIMKKNKVKFNELKGIITVTGPGPFTSLRIAVAIVNTLAYTLKIPVAGIQIKRKKLTTPQIIKEGLLKLEKEKVGTYVSPFYDKEPNIT